LYFERSGQTSTPNRAQRDRLGCGAQALRRRFARQYKIGGLLLAAAVRSRLSAFFITVLATPDLAFPGYLIGHVMGFDAFGRALAALAIIEVPRCADGCERER
jgi:hypothetical protein